MTNNNRLAPFQCVAPLAVNNLADWPARPQTKFVG